MKKKFVILSIIAVIVILIVVAITLVIVERNVVVNPTDGSYCEEKGVNSPKLIEGMVAVYWDENGNEITSENESFDYNQWYNYTATTSEFGVDNTSSKWANAKTADGSYWVWIPRYAYKIEGPIHTDEAQPISIEFLEGTSATKKGIEIGHYTIGTDSGVKETYNIMQNYVVHPAFSYTTSDNITTQLSGIWVAKYEMSMEEKENDVWTHIETDTGIKGDVELIADARRAVSKPGVSSWRSISQGKVFSNAVAYNTRAQSHLIKNNEWGAVAYLTHSAYGRNGVEIEMNNIDYITGGSNVDGATYITNAAQSTTGNEYGIYDLRGGAWELTAGHLKGAINDFGAALINGANEYKEIYIEYDLSHYGDAMYETSLKSTEYTSWNRDYSNMVTKDNPFTCRGGYCNKKPVDDTGIFAFNITEGGPCILCSWRVVLW